MGQALSVPSWRKKTGKRVDCRDGEKMEEECFVLEKENGTDVECSALEKENGTRV